MRLYGGRVLKTKTQRQIASSQEMRDAVVIDVDSTNRYCRVKIQGSNTHIKAYYPENWEGCPVYLKPGNAVRITHPGGNKGRIEVAGHGILLPTAIPGGSVTPTAVTLPDTVLTGCTLAESTPNAMSVNVLAGTIRIDGVTYALAGISMDDATVEMDRFDLFIDAACASVSFDAASATYFRYDSVVIGTDGIAHVVKGSNFAATATTIPDPPAAPTDHVRAGYVLIPPNATAINAGYINKTFTSPVANTLSAVATDTELALASGEKSTTITIGMKDQYGNWINTSASGGKVYTITWGSGDGSLTYGGETVTASTPLVIASLSVTTTVTYTRSEALEEHSPLLMISEASPAIGSTVLYIQLLDISGDKIP